ncbi:unnamed protein product, partial [Rotaria socialis]
MRILCKFLPQNFDQLQYFIKPITYSPLNNNQKAVQVKNKCYKIIQEAKRLWLNILFNACEIKIQAYDSQYQNIFLQLESQSIVTNNVNDSSISNQIKEYLIYRTNKLKQDIYKKVAKSRAIVLQIRQHSSSSRKQKIIGVSPEPYIDLISHQFVKRQWNHLSLGPSCIRLNQSAIRPRKQQEILIKKEHKNIDQKVVHHLTSQPNNIPLKSRILKTYSDDLLNYFNHSYFSPLTYKNEIQALEQARTALSIRRKLKKS